MNEINMSSVSQRAEAKMTSLTGSSEQRKEAGDVGKSLPPQAGKVAENLQEESVDQRLNSAVVELNKFVQSENRDLFFSIDDNLGEVVVRVVNRESGELIRQIPNEVVLDLAVKARDNEPLQLISTHG